MQQVQKEFADNDDVAFVSVQTVFEGHHTNTVERIRETQEKYKLAIPFGHDAGDATTRNRSHILTNYRTGGTPWIIIIDQEGKVVFNDYHVKPAAAIEEDTPTSPWQPTSAPEIDAFFL